VTLPDGTHLLVAKTVENLNGFAQNIGAAIILGVALIFALAGGVDRNGHSADSGSD
jgi:hypothetical protein